MNRIPHTLVALGTMVFVGLHGTALRAQPVVISDLVEAKAVVESVDQKTRMVLLRGDHGELDTGDEVDVTYSIGVAASVVPTRG